MDNEVKLGDGVASELKSEFNSELLAAGKKLFRLFLDIFATRFRTPILMTS